MLSILENHRTPLLVITVFLLSLLSIYSYSFGNAKDKEFNKTLAGCISGTRNCPQHSVVVSAQVKNLSQDYFIVNIRTRKGARWEDLFDRKFDITVFGERPDLTVGDIIALKGHFSSSQIFQLKEYDIEAKWLREIKYTISLLALVLTMFIWFKAFGFSPTELVFFRKQNH